MKFEDDEKSLREIEPEKKSFEENLEAKVNRRKGFKTWILIYYIQTIFMNKVGHQFQLSFKFSQIETVIWDAYCAVAGCFIVHFFYGGLLKSLTMFYPFCQESKILKFSIVYFGYTVYKYRRWL